MHPDDFGPSRYNSTSKQLPSTIDTLDDAIAYLQLARQTMGGNTKFRLVSADYSNDSDEYQVVEDVVLTGNKSLMPKGYRNNYGEYVLFAF